MQTHNSHTAPAEHSARPAMRRDHPAAPADLLLEPECILVEPGFEASEGSVLGQLTVGQAIGSGASATVYKVLPGGASTHHQVFKAIKQVPGLHQAFQREWLIGRRLNALGLGRNPAGRHFMRTGAAVVSTSRRSREQSLDNLQFKGALLEAVDGVSLDKRLEDDASFCDIDYVITMLFQVFTALDAAQQALHFQHQDLRISNIMEQSLAPALEPAAQGGPQVEGWDSPQAAALALGQLQFKIIDFGRSTISDRKSAAYLAERAGAASAGRFSLSLQRIPASSGMLDQLYRWLYSGRSDVWRLLRSLAPRLDGRAWPKRKAARVWALHTLIQEVVNVKLQARFFEDQVVEEDGSTRRVSGNELVYEEAKQEVVPAAAVPTLDVTSAPRRAFWWRKLRDKVLRVWSRLRSRRPRMSAQQALRRMEDLGLRGITPV